MDPLSIESAALPRSNLRFINLFSHEGHEIEQTTEFSPILNENSGITPSCSEAERISTHEEVIKLQNKNEIMRKGIESTEQMNVKLRRSINQKSKKLSNICGELKKYAKVKTRNQDINDQKKILSEVFSDSQINVICRGSKKVKWKIDDMVVAFTIRRLSNQRCYEYLTDTLNIPLPALSSLRKWFKRADDKSINHKSIQRK